MHVIKYYIYEYKNEYSRDSDTGHPWCATSVDNDG